MVPPLVDPPPEDPPPPLQPISWKRSATTTRIREIILLPFFISFHDLFTGNPSFLIFYFSSAILLKNFTYIDAKN
jgi:hypothetical protein